MKFVLVNHSLDMLQLVKCGFIGTFIIEDDGDIFKSSCMAYVGFILC